MRTIHLVSEGTGSQLVVRALQSILTSYGCRSIAQEFKNSEIWQINEIVAGELSPILFNFDFKSLCEFLERYALKVETDIYLWQLLAPSAAQFELTIAQVEELSGKYDRLERVYILSQEFDDLVWNGLFRKISVGVLRTISIPKILISIPALAQNSLSYTDQFGRVTVSIVAARSGSINTLKRIALLGAIFDKVPPYRLLS